MNVHWTESAIEHLAAIHEYIGRNSPHYAARMVDRLTQKTIQIGMYPESGRMVPEFDSPDVREVMEGSFRIIYRITPERIDVLAVVHGARQMPPMN